MIAAEVIEVTKLLQVILQALVATIGVTVLVSLAVLGLVRAGEGPRGATVHTVLYGMLAVVALSGCATAIVYGVIKLS
ncbi:MAG: hypothetical protein ACRDK2_05560 [Solirubrobacteraceae bacterium]